tara:strand:+ start:354 stop:812 length:459 start_codon:yes stop_codon:yes gene_type:complete
MRYTSKDQSTAPTSGITLWKIWRRVTRQGYCKHFDTLPRESQWKEIPYSRYRHIKCEHCGDLLKMNTTAGYWEYSSRKNKYLWWNFPSIYPTTETEINSYTASGEWSYMNHLRDYDPNRYNELKGIKKRLTEKEEDNHINRTAKFEVLTFKK